MAKTQIKSAKLCSKLWTANMLTLAQVLLILFVGSCFCATTNKPATITSSSQNILLTTLNRITSKSLGTTHNIKATTLVPLFTTTSMQKTSTAFESKTTASSTSTLVDTSSIASVTTESYTTTATSSLSSLPTTASNDPLITSALVSSTVTTSVHKAAPLEERLASVDCDLPLLPNESRLWRGNETHELNLPIMMPEDCTNTIPSATSTTGAVDDECPPVILSWEGAADIQSGDILIVRIADTHLLENKKMLIKELDTIRNETNSQSVERVHRTAPQPAVYQVTRQGHEHCDVTEGVLLDITPLAEQGAKLVTLYDKDLTEGVNLLIVVSEGWGSKCVRLKVTVKSDNCGDSQDCSGKGVCYSNVSMEGYECQCCAGFGGPHCEDRDACSPSPCTNRGICIVNRSGRDAPSYQCLCPYGFSGKNCEEEIDPCGTSPCGNGGTCERNGTEYQCACAKGWAGARCQLPAPDAATGACAVQPCVHGICVEQNAQDAKLDGEAYRCFCQPGYAGVRCEYEYNECESSPCANGGTCTDRVGGFVCACGRGYNGRTCQLKVDLCSPNPCPPRRYCIDRGNNYACECPRGFTGLDCAMPAKAACDNNPCAHGGTCWSGVDSFYCACRPGYTGKLCEEDFILESVVASDDDTGDMSLEESGQEQGSIGAPSVREVRLPLALYHDRLHNVYIAAGTLGAAIAIVGIVVTACHCRVNKTYERFLSRVSRVTEPGPPHHWLQDKRPPLHHLQPNHPPGPLDNADMYYTLDFSDSQSSPLIQ